MTISLPTGSAAAATASQSSKAVQPLPAAGADKAKASGDSQVKSAEASARSALNVQILQSSLEVSIQAGDKSQALLFRSAIDKINEALAPDLGPDALQAAMSQDNSPEATAGRIVALSTGFFDAYAAQHPGEDPETLARNFVDLIRGGFEKGFGEAKELLKGLGVLSGDIESGIMKTYDLVHKGLDDFLGAKLAPPAASDTASPGGDKATAASS